MSSDNSLNNGITNLVVNMSVIGTADEELVLKTMKQGQSIQFIRRFTESGHNLHILLLLGRDVGK